MMPLPYRWLTSLMLRYNGSSLLIDCGEGTQIAIKEAGLSFKTDRYSLRDTFSRGSYQRSSGASSDDGKCGENSTVMTTGPKGLNMCRDEHLLDNCTGTSV